MLKFDYAPPYKDGYPKTYFFDPSRLGTCYSGTMNDPWWFSCPFPSGDYGLKASLFLDRDGDGQRDRGERAPAGRTVLLRLLGHTQQSTLQSRAYQTDAAGSFSTTLYTGGYNEPSGHWSICLNDNDERHVIGSLNGAQVESPKRCVELTQLAAGSNNFSIGVVRQ